MSKYTTGELARLTGVSVRTVQYYDDRGILSPSELSEGGRRLYSERELRKMKIICFLRSVGISINGVSLILSERDGEKIVSLLLDEQKKAVTEELRARQEQLDTILKFERELRQLNGFSVESIGDIAHVMKDNEKLKKMRLTMLLSGIPISLFQIASIVLWITRGLWWLFLIWAGAAALYGILISIYYFKRTAYICPECHEVFKSSFKEAFFAHHTPRMRTLICPKCGKKSLCLEVYDKRRLKENDEKV